MKQIILGGKNGIGKFTLIDDEDFKQLNKYKWHIDSEGSVRTPTRDNPQKKMIMKRMHRMIMQPKSSKEIVDHINGNRLDNRKTNLRIVNDQQSSFNRGPQLKNKSGFKGVAWSNQRHKWQAKININNKRIYLGFFNDLLDAAKAYNIGAKKYFSEFARLNEIPA